MNAPLLDIQCLTLAYGTSQILHGVDLRIEEGEALALVGRNGMGKSSLIRAIMGLAPTSSGSIRLRGHSIRGLAPHKIARLGVGLVPEGRQIFPTLSVGENLIMAAANHGDRIQPWTLDSVIALFPRLGERIGQLAGSLSGGERQMLAIGRALMINPRLLILDEATEGLAPIVCDDIWRCLEGLAAQGQSILIVDKNPKALARFVRRFAVMEKGRIAWTGSAERLLAESEIMHRYLGV